ncbi:MAG: PulJ/GspJ family protein [Acidimicrobiales bacterium]
MKFPALRHHARSEEGFTLIELLISVLLTGILITIVMGVLTTFSKVEQNNQSNYDELDQLLPVGTSFQHLLRSAVSSAPVSNGVPTPPFGIYNSTYLLTSTSISPTHLTFFSNTGRTKSTGQLLGPTMVTAVLTCPSITPPSTPTLLKVRACTFTVTIFTAKPTTCPGLTETKTPPTVPCAWTWTPTHHTHRTLFRVGDVNNWTTTATTMAKTTPTPTRIAKAEKPVFSYYLAHTPTTTTLPAPTTPVSFSQTPSTNPFRSCTGPTPILPRVTKCKADHIQSVKVDIEVATPQALRSGRSVPKVEDQTVTYQLSAISQTYTPAVG